MSNREEHPLDEQFRRALAHAEVPPPPQVWRGVQRGLAARSGGMAWWARRLPWLLLLLALVTLPLLLKGPTEHTALALGDEAAQEASIRPPAHAPEPMSKAHERNSTPIAPTNSPATAPAGMATVALHAKAASPATGTSLPNKKAEANADDAVDPYHDDAATGVLAQWLPGHTANESASRTTTQATDPTDPATDPQIAESTTGAAHDRAAKVASTSNEHDVGGLGAFRLDVRQALLDRTMLSATPQGGVRQQPYVLPKGEWWVAAVGGRYDVQRRWAGTDAGLANALQGTETPGATLGLGLLVGHEQRNGWGLSTGLFLERSEQQFRHVDRQVNVEEEIITYLVTLNTQVFVSDVDTLLMITTEETTTKGVNRMHTTRIPLQVHWRGQQGRWSLGAHAGLALEWTRVRHGLSLQRDASDGRPVAAPLHTNELRSRYPVQLIALAGAELGHMLHERWFLHAGPVYQLGHALGSAPVRASATRWGLQVRLAHHFTTRHP